MAQTIIQNLIINRPFAEPTRHFKFDDEGITSQILEARRPSEYFIPIAKPTKKYAQLPLDHAWNEERGEENRMVNDIRVENGMVTVEILGVDVYDPSTDAIRSNPTGELACWFIDTDYNQDAFFVRYAYFTGNPDKKPYDSLQRTLRTEIDEDAWQSLYQTVSRPFPILKTGHIAIKAINHYGDEVMKVIWV